MTRRALIENIEFRLQRRVSKPFIEGAIDIVWEQFCEQFIKQEDPFFYAKTYTDVSVLLDASTGRYYSALPALVVRNGIVAIYPEDSRGIDIIEIPERDFRLMYDQEVSGASEKIFCYKKFDRVFYDENMTAILAAEGVTMDLVVTFSEYGIDEEIPVPTINQASFIDMVVQYISGTPIITTNDTNIRR